MMNTVLIIARKEFQQAFHNRLFLTITALFLALSVLSVYIGSTTKRTEMRIYDERIAELTAQGVTALPTPPEIHTLTILSNLTEYIAIVGAIVAVVLGHNALIEEKESGGLILILTRPVYRDQLLIGKLLGNIAVIALLLALAFVFNLLLLILIGGLVPSLGEVLRLVGLVGLALVYMSIFLIISIMFSISITSSANVFLLALTFWMLVSFVIPQMAATQMANSTVINSINGATNQIPQETTTSRAISFLSPTWHLRHIGAELLQVAPGSAALSSTTLISDTIGTLFILLVPCLVAGIVAFATFLRSETLTLE
jgi:ABC-2 type transport system permease protein